MRSDNQLLKLRSESFDSITMVAYNGDMAGSQINCGVLKKESFAVLIYRPNDDAKKESLGELISIEFVPNNFKFLN